jgi:tetratricopeptide (TPR) repeat protein
MLNINQKNVQTWLQVIQINLHEKNYTELKKTVDLAITILPNMHQFYFYKGIVESHFNNYQEAIKANNMALSFVKEEDNLIKSDYYTQIGDIYYKMDSTNLAFLAYEQALLVNPDNLYVMNNYAYYLSEKKLNLKKAESLSAKTVGKEPKNSTYLDTYAWIFYQQENFTLAKFYIERAIDNMDGKEDSSVLFEHYGDILLKSGNEIKALETWKKAYETGNKNEALKVKIENLTELLKKNEK